MYYLGEIVRAETENTENKLFKINICGFNQYNKEDNDAYNDAPLFVVNETTNDKSKVPSVIVDYGEAKYVISQSPPSTDSCHLDRSLHVLSLVSQLIGLQKKGEKTPVTGVVTFTGGR